MPKVEVIDGAFQGPGFELQWEGLHVSLNSLCFALNQPLLDFWNLFSTRRPASMASVSAGGGDDLFAQLKAADPSELEKRQQAINDRINVTFQRSQQRLAELIDQNSTLATTVSSVTILGAPNTRHGFLKRVVNPLLSANRDRPYTQAEVVREATATAEKLRQFGQHDNGISGTIADHRRHFPGFNIYLP